MGTPIQYQRQKGARQLTDKEKLIKIKVHSTFLFSPSFSLSSLLVGHALIARRGLACATKCIMPVFLLLLFWFGEPPPNASNYHLQPIHMIALPPLSHHHRHHFSSSYYCYCHGGNFTNAFSMLKAMKDAEKQNCLDIAKQIAKLERLLKEEALADGHEADLDTMDEKERRLNEIAVQAVAELPLTVLNFKFQKTGLTKSTCQKKESILRRVPREWTYTFGWAWEGDGEREIYRGEVTGIAYRT